MDPSPLSEEVFRRNRKEFLRFNGFAQNVEALVSLTRQASGSICTIATVPFPFEERQKFLATLGKNGWSVKIGQCTLRLNGNTYLYEEYEVRDVRKQTVLS